MNAPKTLMFFLLFMIAFAGSLSAQSTGKIFQKGESPKVVFNKGIEDRCITNKSLYFIFFFRLGSSK
jgi:hypothetical protein